MAVDQKPKRKWQNLLHQKCPNCDERLELSGLYFVCSNQQSDNASRSCFFIKKERAAEFLLDVNHPANICLSVHERENIEESVQKLLNVV